ncbi:MAG: Gfo/Idh/MocA family oxidoreductase [Eubacteriales bacterium]
MKKGVVIIGFGGQGKWHAKHILASDVVTLAGVYDIRKERNDMATEMGIHAFASLQELLEAKADIALIATPNDVHKQLAIAAMASGKHVICEKPVTLNVADYDEIIAAAKQYGKVFEVHQNRRWDVDFLAMKELINSEKIGKPLYISSIVHGSRGIPGDWRTQKEYGGGMLYDWGIHMIDQLLQLIPAPIVSLYCMTTHYTNSEVDDGYKLYLTFANGVTAFSEVGTYNFISMPRFYGQFEQGTSIIADWHDSMRVVECLNWGEGEVHPVQTASGITKTMAPRSNLSVNEYIAPKPVSDVHDFYRNLVAAIDGKAEKLIADAEVRRVLQVLEAAFESAAKKQVIHFSSPL